MSAPVTDSKPYRTQYPVRIVTAASLFDGHDAAINIMRRILQSTGAEIIHLGHNRSALEVAECAIQEDAQGIAMTSYQGGHVEYLKYMHDILAERGCGHIKIFAGGGGTILPSEIEELHAYGIARIYSPDDGRSMGLQGMINDVMRQCDYPTWTPAGRFATALSLPDGSDDPEHGIDVPGAYIGASEAETLDDLFKALPKRNSRIIGRLISIAENYKDDAERLRKMLADVKADVKIPILGITGTGGSGKSSLVDELVRRYLADSPDKTIAIISVDPSKRKTGGALLGDRIRMNSINNPRVYMRSLATRQSNLALSKYVQESIDICKAAGFNLVIVETSGIGQSDTEITEHSDAALYVMTGEYGAATQLEKIDMLDFADLIAINKFDKRGSLDALRDVKKQYRRNHNLWDTPETELPVYGTVASQFNDPGTNTLYRRVMETITEKTGVRFRSGLTLPETATDKVYIIPPDRVRYLAEIAELNRMYQDYVEEQSSLASRLYQINGTIEQLRSEAHLNADKPAEAAGTLALVEALEKTYKKTETNLAGECRLVLQNWKHLVAKYAAEMYTYQVRDKVFQLPQYTKSLSGTMVPRVSLPKFKDWGDILKWRFTENVPGKFPYAAGVFPLKREGEDPTRMFAGEGGPERTNRRFHYVSLDMPARRLSTAFDSVTLYGEDPARRPDIYGKIGNSGVSVATLDDAKKLYSGFNLSHPATSVSMTINGPAPMLLSFFLNAAIDQQCELYIKANSLEAETEAKIKAIFAAKNSVRPVYQGDLPIGNNGLGLMLLGVTGDQVLPADIYESIKAETLSAVRGTVQADILKEDQAQNTCIFSTEFALRMMGDIQQYFIDRKVRNFYSVSISGYHIAEAGANPITQLAFTLSNGFTFVEYYLSRGMHIDDFAPNFSFFFSNGLDPEYSVIGRVARRIWAKAIRHKYKGNDRSQKLKYHIQTSGRSLHAQEIAFNDIRTTLQALYAIYDNCNSLHTNAYDEAITTPTEESVRRAMAIQLIINKESGLAKNENPLQGSFIIEELTDLVEEAVLTEFRAISERGGVLGAMERMYQRSKIQEESLFYETQKHNGDLPLIGVNTFLDPKGSPTIIPSEVIRSGTEEKEFAITSCENFRQLNAETYEDDLALLQKSAIENGNIFEALMEAGKRCTLGDISHALYEVGGQYRRNM
ncbi:MAG: methylmalonyl-CoA mutase family protein [Bacteroidota bacterium]